MPKLQSPSLRRPRVDSLDVAKGIAIFFIVLGHILPSGYLNYEYVVSFNVAIFFVLSGITFRGDTGGGYPVFLLKRVQRLIVPYLTFGVFSVAIYVGLGHLAAQKMNVVSADNFSFLHNLTALLYGNPHDNALKFNTPLWFLPILFVINQIAYITDRWLHIVRSPGRIPFLMLLFAVFACVLRRENVTYLPLGAEKAFFWIFYFFLGIFIQFYFLNPPSSPFQFRNLSMGLTLIFLGGFLVFCRRRWTDPTEINEYHPLFYLFHYTFGTISTLGYLFLARFIDKSRFIECVGQNTLGILVIHKFPIVFIQMAVPFWTVMIRGNYLSASLITALGVTVLCLGISLMIQRFAPFLLGIPIPSPRKRSSGR